MEGVGAASSEKLSVCRPDDQNITRTLLKHQNITEKHKTRDAKNPWNLNFLEMAATEFVAFFPDVFFFFNFLK